MSQAEHILKLPKTLMQAGACLAECLPEAFCLCLLLLQCPPELLAFQVSFCQVCRLQLPGCSIGCCCSLICCLYDLSQPIYLPLRRLRW